MRSLRHRGWFGLVLVLAAACSSGDDPITPPLDGGAVSPDSAPESPDGAPQSPDASDAPVEDDTALCTQVATLACTYDRDCMPGEMARLFGSFEECLTTKQASCLRTAALPGAVDAPRHLRDCWQVSGGCLDDSDHPECAAVPGQKNVDAPCEANLQCASNHCSRPSVGAACGKCIQGVPLGGACDFYSDCDNGFCSGGICHPQGALGAACADSVDCAFPLFCSNGTCKQPTYGKAGDACDFDGRLCTEKDGLLCSFSKNVCTRYKIVGVGEGCGFDDGDGTNDCRKPAYCALEGDSFVCSAPLPEGAACTSNRYCGNNTCANGVCSKPTPDVCEAKPSPAPASPAPALAPIGGEKRIVSNLPSDADLLSPRFARELARNHRGSARAVK